LPRSVTTLNEVAETVFMSTRLALTLLVISASFEREV
jgi:hypothetical protein